MKPVELISLTAVNRCDNAKSRKIYAKSRAKRYAECNRANPAYICRAITAMVYSANRAHVRAITERNNKAGILENNARR